MKKNNSFLFIFISLILILGGIAITAFISRAKEGNSSDIRAKAGTISGLRVSAIVDEIDETKGTFSVSKFRFANSEENSDLGTWTVTPPPRFFLSSLSPGSVVTMSIDPTTMLAVSHTVAATQIIVEK